MDSKLISGEFDTTDWLFVDDEVLNEYLCRAVANGLNVTLKTKYEHVLDADFGLDYHDHAKISFKLWQFNEGNPPTWSIRFEDLLETIVDPFLPFSDKLSARSVEEISEISRVFRAFSDKAIRAADKIDAIIKAVDIVENN